MTKVHIFDAALARAAKNQREITLLLENACGDKKMSFSQINSLESCKRRKNNQNDKKDRHHGGCCHRQCLESPTVKPPTQRPQEGPRLSPSQFFRMKSPILSPQDCFSCKDGDPDYTAASFRTFKWRQRQKDDPLAPYLPDFPSMGFFLFTRKKSELAGL
jgi:hypothetical protein